MPDEPLVLEVGVAVLAVNASTALLYAWDKRAAIRGRGRISERTLLGAGLLGGWPAAWCTMVAIRHKTRKLSFKLKLGAITALWVAGLAVGGWQVYSA